MSFCPEMDGLRPIDAQLITEHCFLQADDRCCYLWEYRPGRPRSVGERVICDLKIRPSEVARFGAARGAKCRAIDQAALALRKVIPRAWAEEVSWCPIPPSSCREDPDYDDRLSHILVRAFHNYDVDVRLLLGQSQSTPPDHRRPSRRLTFDRLYSIMRIDVTELSRRPLRRHLLLFDDLLTTGKHFKCAQRRLHEAMKLQRPIGACFLARRLLSPARRGSLELPGMQISADYGKS